MQDFITAEINFAFSCTICFLQQWVKFNASCSLEIGILYKKLTTSMSLQSENIQQICNQEIMILFQLLHLDYLRNNISVAFTS